MVVPTPAADLIDGAAVIGGAFQFMPTVTDALLIFIVLSLGWAYGGRVLSWARKFGRK